MHLFKNKTKDVKQFLEEMKANKTNKSSNRNSLEKSNKSVVSSSHSKSPYPSTSFGNANKPNLESRRSNMNSVDSRESNLSVNGSINPSNARISSGGNRCFPSPPHIHNQRQSYNQTAPRYQDKRQIASQAHQYFPNDFMNPVSEPIMHDFSNNLAHHYSNQRRFNSFDDTRSFHNQPYHNINQPMMSQNFQNSHDSYPAWSNGGLSRHESSQNSTSTVYENSQQYQNQNFGRISQSFDKPIQKPQPSNYLRQSSNIYSLNMQNPNKIQKNHFNSSQQLSNNRLNQQRYFATQISSFDYGMEEISEAEQGLSTEKDSPSKISQFLSKNKNLNANVKETPIKKITDEQKNIFQVFEDQFNGTQSNNKKISKENNQEVKDIKNFDKKSFIVPKKVQFKSLSIQTENIKEKQEKIKKLRVTENQKKKLNQNFHQIHESYLEIDKLLKETSILFNNIQRSSNEFNKKIKSNESYLKYLGKTGKYQNEKMEIEEMPKVQQTLKKKNYQAKRNDLQNEKTFKKEHMIREIEI